MIKPHEKPAKPRHSVSDAEVDRLTDLALDAINRQADVQMTDGLGRNWDLRAVHDPALGLAMTLMQSFPPDETGVSPDPITALRVLSGALFGTEQINDVLQAQILALDEQVATTSAPKARQ
jgi:hypothetical protein